MIHIDHDSCHVIPQPFNLAWLKHTSRPATFRTMGPSSMALPWPGEAPSARRRNYGMVVMTNLLVRASSLLVLYAYTQKTKSRILLVRWSLVCGLVWFGLPAMCLPWSETVCLFQIPVKFRPITFHHPCIFIYLIGSEVSRR